MKNKEFVLVQADIHCNWEGKPPNYRVWVNDELFGERTYIWKDEYLEEVLQIYAPIGKYTIKWELVPPFTGRIRAENLRVIEGPGRIVKGTILRIGEHAN